MILIYITNPDKRTALKIAKYLLEQRLIACANIFPIDSLYWWQGKIEKTKEYILLAKTKDGYYQKVKQAVKKIHPYKVPCILKIKALANKEYQKWLQEETISGIFK